MLKLNIFYFKKLLLILLLDDDDDDVELDVEVAVYKYNVNEKFHPKKEHSSRRHVSVYTL